MIEFFKNLFKKKGKCKKSETVNNVEHYIKDEDIHVYVNRKEGVIKIEAPSDKELSKDEIIEICREFYED